MAAMTIEEAGEIVLSAKAWDDCSVCGGGGIVRKTKLEVGDPISISDRGKAISNRICTDCKGAGGSINTEYKEACSVVGRELPPDLVKRARPWTEKVLDATASAAQAPIGYLTGKLPDGKVKVQHSMDMTSFVQHAGAEYIYEADTRRSG